MNSPREGVLSKKVPASPMEVKSSMLIMTDTKNLEKVTLCWGTGVFGNWNSAALAEPYPEKVILKN